MLHRALAVRRRHRLCRRNALQARRLPALSLRDQRLRPTWTRIDGGIPAHDFTRVIRADPERAGPALRRHRNRPVRLVRRWRHLAALPAQSAGRADPRTADQGQRPDRRHARPLHLDPGRPHARCARSPAGIADRHLSMPPTRHPAVLPGIDWSRQVPGWTNYLGGIGGAYTVTIDARWRSGSHLPGPRREPARRRHHHLPPDQQPHRTHHPDLQEGRRHRSADLLQPQTRR